MSTFSEPAYQTKLDETIQELESKSSIEFVVVVYPESNNYRDVELWGGIFLAFAVLTYAFMTPTEIDIYIILFGTLLAFSLGIGLIKWVKPLKRFLINTQRMRRNSEIMARAIFQKAGVYRTSGHTGVLLFLSEFEHQTILLWDLGVDMELTIDELEEMQLRFSTIFKTTDVAATLLTEIEACTPVFEQRLPIQPNDINELPNHLKIEL